MMQQIAIAELMDTSGVKFGTSGARGLVSDMTDAVVTRIPPVFSSIWKRAVSCRVRIAGSPSPGICAPVRNVS